MAELLIRAKAHWMDSLKQADINKMTASELQSYNSRSQIGDIIVVRPDGWAWGKEECLPNFVVVKLPNISVDTIKIYEEQLWDRTDPEHPVMLKRRKFRVPENYIKNLASLSQSTITIDTSQITSFRGTIIEKVS